MKKFLLFLFALTAAALLISCAERGANSASGELEYSLNRAGDAYTVVGVGDYTGLDLVIPETYQGLPVTAIDITAFCGRSALTGVTIPASITKVSGVAFTGCTGLTGITVSEGNPVYHSAGNCLIDTQEKMLVLGCKTSVIPTDGSVTAIGESAFAGCTGLTGITIPDSVIRIDSFAFSGCTGLTGITIPASVMWIGNAAFESCFGLTSLTIPDGVTGIGNIAFRLCEELTSITLPASVTELGGLLFQGCSALTSITVSDGNPVYHSSGNCLIQTQEKTLVFGCKASVIPGDGSVTKIAERAFDDCGGLTSIALPDSVTEIGKYAFEACKELTSITIPDGVTAISEATFLGCEGLTSITLPDGMTEIGRGAFYGCASLTSITIPASVTAIGPDIFGYCSSLTDIYYGGTSAQWAELTKDNGILSTATVHYGGEE